MALSNDDRALLEKFNDRATSPDRESIEKRTDDKPITPEESRELQTLADKFNDRVNSADRKPPGKESVITNKFNDAATAPPAQDKGDTTKPHAPAASLASGPAFNGPGGDTVRRETFNERQEKADDAAKPANGDGGNDGPSDNELAEYQGLVDKFNDRVTAPPMLDNAYDREH